MNLGLLDKLLIIVISDQCFGLNVLQENACTMLVLVFVKHFMDFDVSLTIIRHLTLIQVTSCYLLVLSVGYITKQEMELISSFLKFT